jgi:hypothetical protein
MDANQLVMHDASERVCQSVCCCCCCCRIRIEWTKLAAAAAGSISIPKKQPADLFGRPIYSRIFSFVKELLVSLA